MTPERKQALRDAANCLRRAGMGWLVVAQDMPDLLDEALDALDQVRAERDALQAALDEWHRLALAALAGGTNPE